MRGMRRVPTALMVSVGWSLACPAGRDATMHASVSH
jgi:hypothetical protein